MAKIDPSTEVEEYTKDELGKWFETKAMSLKSSGVIRNKILDASDRFAKPQLEFVGNMYFFRYDPKHKLKLPVYDMDPLVVVVDQYVDGFLGLNLHYLSKGSRGATVSIFNEFYEKKRLFNGIISGSSKSNWDIITSASSGLESMARQSVHRYLYTHVRSQFIRIEKDEYNKAIQLPIDQWVYRK